MNFSFPVIFTLTALEFQKFETVKTYVLDHSWCSGEIVVVLQSTDNEFLSFPLWMLSNSITRENVSSSTFQLFSQSESGLGFYLNTVQRERKSLSFSEYLLNCEIHSIESESIFFSSSIVLPCVFKWLNYFSIPKFDRVSSGFDVRSLTWAGESPRVNSKQRNGESERGGTWEALSEFLQLHSDTHTRTPRNKKSQKKLPNLMDFPRRSPVTCRSSRSLETRFSFCDENFNWNGVSLLFTSCTLRQIAEEKRKKKVSINYR